MSELGKVESLTGEEEHETNEMERESLGNGREGMEATEGSDAMNQVHCSTGVGQRVSLRPPPYVFACQRSVAFSRRTWGARRRILELADHLVSYSNVETILVIADPLPRLFMPIVPNFLLLIRFDSN